MLRTTFCCGLLLFAGCTAGDEIDPVLLEQAQTLTEQHVIVDGHIDVPYRMSMFTEDVSGPTFGGDFDYPRAKAGGLNAPFMSIYIPSDRQEMPGAARALADSLIDIVEGFVAHAPDKFAIASSVADVREHKRAGLVSLPMGMENGAPIDSLADLNHFYARGIRYITLTHARDNQISDSSYDSTRTWGGLSPYGMQVVDAMNRLGIIVDVSHLTDSTIYQVLRRSQAPVFASHSSARHFTPGWQRNMSDDLIQALAARDGVILISFGSSFLKNEYREQSQALGERIDTYLAESGIDPRSEEGVRYQEAQRKANPVGTVQDLVDHIDHVVGLVGVNHVGLGSDYDGVTALPARAGDVSTYPHIVAELLTRGYTDGDIAKVLGENALRVWTGVEQTARQLQATD